MKKYSLSFAALLFLAACGSRHEEPVVTEHDTMEEAAAPATGKVDPVCHMAYESSWDAFSATGTDTTWFCSPRCKESFDKNPAKYTTATAE